MYSIVQTAVDQCVYFTSVTIITTVQTGIKIYLLIAIAYGSKLRCTAA
jgi:heme/copper-type cytochrome/quinol oxidase subunit 1